MNLRVGVHVHSCKSQEGKLQGRQSLLLSSVTCISLLFLWHYLLAIHFSTVALSCIKCKDCKKNIAKTSFVSLQPQQLQSLMWTAIQSQCFLSLQRVAFSIFLEFLIKNYYPQRLRHLNWDSSGFWIPPPALLCCSEK